MGDIWEGWEYEKGGQSEGVNLGFKPAGRSVHQRVHLERVFFVCCFSFFLNTYHKAEIRLGGSFVAGLTITAITLKTVFNYLFVRLKMSCTVLELLLLLLIFTRPCHGECSSLAKKEVIEAALQAK